MRIWEDSLGFKININQSKSSEVCCQQTKGKSFSPF
jgi:hypothetical protein